MSDSQTVYGPKPRSRDGGKRQKRTIRFSDAEWRWLETQAGARDKTVSDLVRDKALRGMPRAEQ